MHQYLHQEVINGINIHVAQNSLYPIPWTGPKQNRPANYYDQIETIITYTNDNNEHVSITLPTVALGENRSRRIQVTVNGQQHPFNQAALTVLDMHNTFDLPEIEALLHLININETKSDNSVRACLPFFYLPRAHYRMSKAKMSSSNQDGHLVTTNGNLKDLLAPYLAAIKENSTQQKELYIPVATNGDPHHWVFFSLKFNEQNKPTILLFDSSAHRGNQQLFNYFIDTFWQNIAESVNQALVEHDFTPVEKHDAEFVALKFFSYRGCGFTVSNAINRLFNGTPLVNSKKLSDVSIAIDDERYDRVSMQEDALARVQLAFALTAHDRYIAQSKTEVQDKYKYAFESVLRELRTHPHTLKIKAEEVFSMPVVVPKDEAKQLMAFSPIIPVVPNPKRPKIKKNNTPDNKLLNIFEQEYDELLKLLQAKINELKGKADKNNKNYQPKYQKAAHAAGILHDVLIAGNKQFFKNPTPAHYKLFKAGVEDAVDTAMVELQQHRSLWHSMSPVLRALAGILATIVLFPALIVSEQSRHKYRTAFFKLPDTDSAEKLTLFKDSFRQLEENYQPLLGINSTC